MDFGLLIILWSLVRIQPGPPTLTTGGEICSGIPSPCRQTVERQLPFWRSHAGHSPCPRRLERVSWEPRYATAGIRTLPRYVRHDAAPPLPLRSHRKNSMLRHTFAFASPALALALLASPAAAVLPQRTFVASYGLTANTSFNCSIAKPCRAFGEAIGVTNSGGEVIVLDSAGYGPVTITKSVSIIAPAGIYAGVSVTSGDGIIINAPGGNVVLRGLSISGLGGSAGINIASATSVELDDIIVSNMGTQGVVTSSSGRADDQRLRVSPQRRRRHQPARRKPHPRTCAQRRQRGTRALCPNRYRVHRLELVPEELRRGDSGGGRGKGLRAVVGCLG